MLIQINKRKKKLYKSKNIIIKSIFNTKLTDHFISKFPELASGRKNYYKKEVDISKNICLAKLFCYAKKLKASYIEKIKLKTHSNKVVLTAKVFY